MHTNKQLWILYRPSLRFQRRPILSINRTIQVPWAIGHGRLNTSPKLDAYTSVPSTLSSIAALLLTESCLFSGKVSSLDAFRSYPRQLSCSACPVGQLIDQRLRCPVPLVLGATSPQTTTPLSGRDRPVSRRSKPSSRSPLMGEQPIKGERELGLDRRETGRPLPDGSGRTLRGSAAQYERNSGA